VGKSADGSPVPLPGLGLIPIGGKLTTRGVNDFGYLTLTYTASTSWSASIGINNTKPIKGLKQTLEFSYVNTFASKLPCLQPGA